MAVTRNKILEEESDSEVRIDRPFSTYFVKLCCLFYYPSFVLSSVIHDQVYHRSHVQYESVNYTRLVVQTRNPPAADDLALEFLLLSKKRKRCTTLLNVN